MIFCKNKKHSQYCPFSVNELDHLRQNIYTVLYINVALIGSMVANDEHDDVMTWTHCPHYWPIMITIYSKLLWLYVLFFYSQIHFLFYLFIDVSNIKVTHFRIIGPLWVESTNHRRIPLHKASNADLSRTSCSTPSQDNDQWRCNTYPHDVNMMVYPNPLWLDVLAFHL